MSSDNARTAREQLLQCLYFRRSTIDTLAEQIAVAAMQACDVKGLRLRGEPDLSKVRALALRAIGEALAVPVRQLPEDMTDAALSQDVE